LARLEARRRPRSSAIEHLEQCQLATGIAGRLLQIFCKPAKGGRHGALSFEQSGAARTPENMAGELRVLIARHAASHVDDVWFDVMTAHTIDLVAGTRHISLSSESQRRFARRARPRCSRDRTVPTAHPNVAAASL
jgi:hypothetical protein